MPSTNAWVNEPHSKPSVRGSEPAADDNRRQLQTSGIESRMESQPHGREPVPDVARVNRATPILFLQTKVLFDETLPYAEELCACLGLTNLQPVEPDPDFLEDEDPQNALWISNPDRCCFIRKVQPFRRVLTQYDCRISGLKRAHGGARRSVEPIELEDGRIKLNPLFGHTLEDIDRAFETYELSRHPLTRMGYRSIGCIPCTRLAETGESARAGRWARGAKTECGIHSLLYARTRQESGARNAERNHSYYRRS